MQPVSIVVLAFGAVVAAIPFPSDVPSSDHQVVVSSDTPQIPGAITIPIEEVIKNAKLNEEQTPAQDRMESDMGFKKMKKFMKGLWGEEEHVPPPQQGWGQPGLVGPFAFQLGAYYNPILPIPAVATVHAVPALQIHTPAVAPAAPPCNPCAGYGPPAAPTTYNTPSYSSPY